STYRKNTAGPKEKSITEIPSERPIKVMTTSLTLASGANASRVTGTVRITKISKYNPSSTSAHRFIIVFVCGLRLYCHPFFHRICVTSGKVWESVRVAQALPSASLNRAGMERQGDRGAAMGPGGGAKERASNKLATCLQHACSNL